MSEKCLQCARECAILIIQKITNGVTTKYVYGLGLIGEEKCGDFKTYHFDYRGSTAAITDSCGNVTDTFEYDTYGNLTGRTGNSFVIFGYNGRDGVVTDKNGLIYMRARYYDPLMHRFINADVVPGEISDAVTLNRYAYANGNPVSNTDPFGLSAEERASSNSTSISDTNDPLASYNAIYVVDYSEAGLDVVGHAFVFLKDKDGTWIKTEFNTTGGSDIPEKKNNAKVSVKDNYTSKMVLSDLKEGVRKLYMSSGYGSGIFTDGLEFFLISGDFSESIKLARSYKDTNYGGYDLLKNNCLHYVVEILRAGTASHDGIENVLNTSTVIVPKGFLNQLVSVPK